ncbi:hypothetical protein [Paenibacillus ihuae]|uniref:hypothetical protein n=1 Tax=Paenibacillus ihuae TaxID=1232431 RepID=UPI0006D56410|nr:hypothetical protein [Paenibacillus ihuae]
MLKEELLKQIESEGLKVSKSMFERYYQHGLIVSKREGYGRRGVRAKYHERTMDAIRLIEELKQDTLIQSQKDYIFILFWRGYPIQWDKLKARLIEYHCSIMNAFNTITQESANSEFSDFIHEVAEEEALKAPKPSGRPSNHSLDAKKKAAKDTARRYLIVIELISGIITKGSISMKVFQSFSGDINLTTHGMQQEALLEHVNQWLHLNTWKSAVGQSEEQDYTESFKLISTIKDYFGDIESSFGDIYKIPLLGPFIVSIEGKFKIKLISDQIDLYRSALLFLIAGNFRKPLQEFLSLPETRHGWRTLISEWPSTVAARANGKEVQVNG